MNFECCRLGSPTPTTHPPPPISFPEANVSTPHHTQPPRWSEFVSVYIDDVVIYSETMADHLHHLRQVLERLQHTSLKLKLSKCSFICKEVEFLGHHITPDGLQITSAVQVFPRLKNVKQTRLCHFYRRFIQSFAKIAKPLHQLTKKGVAFDWTTHCGTAFLALKTNLCEAPVLAYPSFDKDFSLETDASIDGIGAVLSQQQVDGLLRPVAFASRSLSPAERNYANHRFGDARAVTHFRCYL